MTENDLKSFYKTKDFESWQDEKFVYIHLIDRGLDLSFLKDDFKQFVSDVKATYEVILDEEESK
tara:strand:+ start:99 stop:290 length:192 start_codon:yes stop_codon:yes gene_type:complete